MQENVDIVIFLVMKRVPLWDDSRLRDEREKRNSVGNCDGYSIVERSALLWGGKADKLQTYPAPPLGGTSLPCDLKFHVFCF